MIGALERMTDNLAGLEGKKALLFIGEHLPERPGAELFRYAYDQFAPHMGVQANLDLQMLTGVMGNTRPQDIEDFSKKASSNGVTIYTINAGQIDSEITSAEGDLQDSEESFTRHANTAASFQTMAEMTGGVALTQTTNFDLAFDTINRDLDSYYYSLGYKPAGEGSINARKIVVKMKNRAYNVRSRQALVVKSSDEQMTDRVIANLFTDAAASRGARMDAQV